MIKLPKIWLMRQAGRYLPEYQKIRKDIKSFLDLCYNPEKAAEVTLQPIERFGLSAAIVFSDILVTADSLGVKVEFKENIGPVLEKIESLEQAKNLQTTQYCTKFSSVKKTIEIAKKSLNETPIIGFIGGSWTICAYLLEGRGKTNFQEAVKKIYTDPKIVETLINKVTEQNIYYLKEQIRGGADIVQIFESHCGIVPNEYLEQMVINPTNVICKEIKKEFPNIKIIGFPRGSGFSYEKFIAETDVDIIGCDQSVPIEKMKTWQKDKIIQGNLDPLILFSNPDVIKNQVDKIMQTLDNDRLIFNLGHGILPNTPVENVKFLVEYVKTWKQK
jgi:uroporphyrinogen decarboxylase